MNRAWPWLVVVGGGVTALVFLLKDRVQATVVSANRTPQSILDAVATIDPEHNPELQPGYGGPGYTWCNKAAYQMLYELGVILPWPALVNDMIAYIDGGNDGWYPTSESGAQAAALEGQVAVATWYNLGGHGHMALVLPYAGAVQIAQAGAINFNQGSVRRGFGNIHPNYYAHA
jgi:hypothetical protein